MVPRYFMNVRYRGRLFSDEEGDELAEEALHDHAMTTARSLIQNAKLQAVRNWFDCTFEITNEAGEMVSVLPFGDAAQTRSE